MICSILGIPLSLQYSMGEQLEIHETISTNQVYFEPFSFVIQNTSQKLVLMLNIIRSRKIGS